jgi:hypothetical protein
VGHSIWLGAGAGSGVSQAIAKDAQFAGHPAYFPRHGRGHLPVDTRLPVRREHEGDLIEREAGGAPLRHQRQPFQHAC